MRMDEGGRERQHAHDGHNMSMGINGQLMDMSVINERVRLGQWERWRVENDDGHHPFHVHGCSFLVLSRGWQTGERKRTPAGRTPSGSTTALSSWSASTIQATDQHPYMYHCHILEHEDMGMMGQFTVA